LRRQKGPEQKWRNDQGYVSESNWFDNRFTFRDKKSEAPTRKGSGHIECKLLKFIKTNTLPNKSIATKQFDFCYEDINEDDLLSYLSQGIKSKVFM